VRGLRDSVDAMTDRMAIQSVLVATYIGRSQMRRRQEANRVYTAFAIYWRDGVLVKRRPA
jgi:hypothetical protein